MFFQNIKKLVQYGIDTGLTPECERIYTTNLLLDVFQEDNYEDIINLKRPISEKHLKMSIKDRAAQFAPFAALKGYDDSIDETKEPIWTNQHLEELFNDFYLIPKSK